MSVFVVLCVLTFLLALVGDYVETLHIVAVHEWRPKTAACYSIAMWAISLVGIYIMLEVSWWLILPEGFGLWCGTILAMKRCRPPRVDKPVDQEHC